VLDIRQTQERHGVIFYCSQNVESTATETY
jgi:hypothetical protein